ncbi:hypothetical protein R1sor_002161 [Riccia sorocarpa]|uniref:Aminotransferase-like plant mobile domain-containing protein n=1 Tax=Riccia sorocarpa TaxID=122646 RepID=A0ABD3H3Z3_9MARC
MKRFSNIVKPLHMDPHIYSMTVIAKLFWCNSRGQWYLTPMIYAHLWELHGNPYHWTKVLLHGLKTEILSVQKESRNLDNRRSIHVGWTPILVYLLYTFREHLFLNSPLASNDTWVQRRMSSKSGDATLSNLSAKYKEPIADIYRIRELCKLEDLDDVPEADIVTEASTQGKKAAATPTPKSKSPQMSERKCMHAVKENIARVLAASKNMMLSVKIGALQATNETLTKKIKDLQENSTSKVEELKADNDRLTVKVQALNSAKESHGVKIQELQKHIDVINNNLNIFVKTLKKRESTLKATLAAQSLSKVELEELHRLWVSASALERSNVEMENELFVLKSEKSTAIEQLATITASLNAVKHAFDKEVQAHTEAQLRIEYLQDELNTLQFKLE